LQQRIKEVVGRLDLEGRLLLAEIKKIFFRHYSILYPFQCEYLYARKLRCSPLYSVLETKGAVFGIKMAYERALYFDPTYKSMFYYLIAIFSVRGRLCFTQHSKLYFMKNVKFWLWRCFNYRY
jgi:hypothetical protein